MILKFFEIAKIDLSLNKFLLFYGINDGLRDEEISKIKFKFETVERYNEKEIFENTEKFFENIYNGSLFERNRCIIVNNSSDKLVKIIEELNQKNIEDIVFIFLSYNLDKRSKLRKKFEVEKNFIAVPFYADTNETLFRLAQNFFKKKKISISSENINFIIGKCNGNRGYLNKELDKIEFFAKDRKNILTRDLFNLTNLTENYSVFELVDNCLAKNYKKTINILNENNFRNEDSIIIIRTFLSKLKKILKLACEFEKNKNLNLTINNARPPIFWKDKELITQQLLKWKSFEIENLIYDLNDIELQIKRITSNHINIVSNFILEKSA